MRVILTEKQIKNLLGKFLSENKTEVKELSKNSVGVQEFISHVKGTKGLLNHLGFDYMDDLEEFIYSNGYKDFDELKKDAKKFKPKKD